MALEEFPFDGGARRFATSWFELRDGNAECRHGRCAFDRTAPCGCFPIEQARKLAAVPSKRGGSLPKPDRALRGPEAKRRMSYPPWLKRKAVSMYKRGMSSRDVGELLGVNPWSVLQWVRQAGVEVRRPGKRRAT